jgi:UDP-N-acetylmuramoylalanine--D-glutamate ligase
VKRVYTIGAAAGKIESQLKPVLPKTDFVSAGTLEAAVKSANQLAAPGDVVLLAPACASFDQFESFEQRGKLFKELVTTLANKAAKGREGSA